MGGTTSQYLWATGFTFSIPTDEIVTGISLRVRKMASGNWIDHAIRLLKSGAVDGDDKATTDLWPSTLTDVWYGGPTDLWGLFERPTVSDFNTGAIGAAVATTEGMGMSVTAEVDVIELTVHTNFVDDDDDEEPEPEGDPPTNLLVFLYCVFQTEPNVSLGEHWLRMVKFLRNQTVRAPSGRHSPGTWLRSMANHLHQSGKNEANHLHQSGKNELAEALLMQSSLRYKNDSAACRRAFIDLANEYFMAGQNEMGERCLLASRDPSA